MTLVHVERTQKILDDNLLDGLIAATPANLFYLTGIESVGLRLFPFDYLSFAVITRDEPDKPVFIVSKSLASQVLDGFDGIQKTITYGEFFRYPPFDETNLTMREEDLLDLMTTPSEASALAALSSSLAMLGLSPARIGIDEQKIPYSFLQSLEANFPQAQFVTASNTFQQIRKVKTPTEIERLKTVNAINERAIQAVLTAAHEGITECELVRTYEMSISCQGAESVLTLIRIGRNAAFGEIKPDQSQLKKGDLIWFDVVSKYQGYWSDIARAACLGEPSQRASNYYQALLLGEQYAIDHARPGLSGDDLFNMTMEATRSHGIDHYKRSHVGHGIGAEVYEQVLIAPGVEDVLEVGTVVNIETPYYETGLGALHVEDPFVVGEKGNELLTTLDRSMLIIE